MIFGMGIIVTCTEEPQRLKTKKKKKTATKKQVRSRGGERGLGWGVG